MTGLFRDFQYAFRQLRKNPGFTLTAVVVLALGIGANVAIFSFVDELWLHAMPVRAADRVVRIFTNNLSSQGDTEKGLSSYPDFLDLRTNSKTLAGVAALQRRGLLVDDGVQNRLVPAAVVSENFFDVLQTTPACGRVFHEKELQNSPDPVVVISYAYWQRQFNRDPSLPGKTITADRHQVTVLGVLPRGFRSTEPLVVQDIWIPVSGWKHLTGEKNRTADRADREYEMFGLLQDGVSLQQARAELETIAGSLAVSYPKSNAGHRMTVVAESDTRGGGKIAMALLGIALLVLLIACANVAGLLLARGEHRQREVGMRLALGASRAAVMRLILAETIWLAAFATGLAVLFGHMVISNLPSFMPQTSFPIVIDAHINMRALLFALGSGVLSLFVFGLFPALRATNVAPSDVVKQANTRVAGGRRTLRNTLTVSQVALSLVMVVCTGLLARSVIKGLAQNPGFNAHQNMLILDLLPAFGTDNDQGSQAYVNEARRKLAALPGVTGTTTAMRFPFGISGGGVTHKIFLQQNMGSQDVGATINFDPVGDGYFQLLGTNILRGRAIEQHDLDTSAQVVVVNQSMAQRFWPTGDALGKRFRLEKPDGDEYEVVGVAEDGKYNDIREDRMPYMFVPLSANNYGELALAVKTSIDAEALAPAVRRTLREINRDVPILALVTLRNHMHAAFFEEQIIASLIGVMGGLGLILAAVGIYGLMAFLVGRRTSEIGVRMAMGAQRETIFWMIVEQAARLVVMGTVIGVAGSVAAGYALRSLLFGVAPVDVLTILMAIAVLTGVAFLAATIPARRAAQVDPMVVLRYE